MITLLDDQALGTHLRADAGFDGNEVFTTGCWYVRLCQAVLIARGRTGALSGPFMTMPERERRAALRAVLELPADVGLLSLRELGPLIAEVRARHRLNLLSAEALAAGMHLGATVRLSTDSPQLQGALAVEGVAVERVG